MSPAIEIKAGDGPVSLASLRAVLDAQAHVTLSHGRLADLERSAEVVRRVVEEGRTVYGVNTGFGLLANTRIAADQLAQLQRNLVLSHSTGVGPLLPDPVVRLVIVLKLLNLSRGASGVRRDVVDALSNLLRHEIYPCIPSKGSVGASGDLAPLAHLSAALIGVGQVSHRGETLPAAAALARVGLHPLELGPKEGLALLNGTQVSTALALKGLFMAEDVFAAAIAAGALSTDAMKGSDAPYDARIHALRGQPGQIEVAAALRDLLAGSEIRESHRRDCQKVQDPYSLRCQPQVMGACLDLLRQSARTLEIEANAVTDNPLVFPDDGRWSQGQLPCRAGGLRRRPDRPGLGRDRLHFRTADLAPHGPPFQRPAGLSGEGGGRKLRLHDRPGHGGGPRLGEQAAGPPRQRRFHSDLRQSGGPRLHGHPRRAPLTEMADNAAHVVAIELLSAAQGIDFHRPLRSSARHWSGCMARSANGWRSMTRTGSSRRTSRRRER
jgi:histidine ammonia-lyase